MGFFSRLKKFFRQKKSAFDIVLETVDYYRTHPRGVETTHCINVDDEHDTCVYLTDEGNMCAIGRCLKPEFLAMLGGGGALPESGGISEVCHHYSVKVDEILKEEYRGHTMLFWSNLQHLHDFRSNWEDTEKGTVLTRTGKRQLDDTLTYCCTKEESSRDLANRLPKHLRKDKKNV